MILKAETRGVSAGEKNRAGNDSAFEPIERHLEERFRSTSATSIKGLVAPLAV